jgi:4'-phosphopantetheinyl transferase
LNRTTTKIELGAEVDVWVVELTPSSSDEAALPQADRERARSFLRPEAAELWRASRLALRQALSGYLGKAAAEIEIVPGEHGKPRLARGGLEFNLSHSGELALVAVSPTRPVGVDVEKMEPGRDFLALAERALGAGDTAAVRAAGPGERVAVFYRRWVRHEARLKCLGVGLTGSAPELPVEVRDLEVAAGYAAAVAIG